MYITQKVHTQDKPPKQHEFEGSIWGVYLFVNVHNLLPLITQEFSAARLSIMINVLPNVTRDAAEVQETLYSVVFGSGSATGIGMTTPSAPLLIWKMTTHTGRRET